MSGKEARVKGSRLWKVLSPDNKERYQRVYDAEKHAYVRERTYKMAFGDKLSRIYAELKKHDPACVSKGSTLYHQLNDAFIEAQRNKANPR